MVATEFDQHVKYMSALRDEFASQSDVKHIKQIGEVKQWLQDACSAKDHEVMEAIKGLTATVAQLQTDATYPHAPEAHSQQVQELQSQNEQSKDNVAKLHKEIRFLEGHLLQLAEREGSLKTQEGTLQGELTKTEPRLRHLLSLYAHISKITWHYERSDRVAGTVSDPASGDIQLFDLDPAAMSEYALVNVLWDKLPC